LRDDRSVILERMLSSIDNALDKSVGSFIYDSLAASSIELENSYKQKEDILTKVFADTATDRDLERIVSEVGIRRKDSTKASGYVTITGINGSKIVKGEKVATDSLNYLFLEDKVIENKTIDVLVECEVDGSRGNIPAGAIKYFPKTLQGLQTVTNKEEFKNGYDIEDDYSLRERYYIKARTPSTSGNKYHYEQWALEVLGVGSAKCIPGAGNVKVIIADSNKRKASEELIRKVYDHVDSERPVLAGTLTVVTVTEKTINVTANVEIDKSVVLGNVQEEFKKSVEDYFDNTVYISKKISIAKLGALLMDIDGVVDYSNLKINGSTSNITLAEDEIAVVSIVTLGV